MTKAHSVDRRNKCSPLHSLPLVVGEGDSLGGDLEVDDGGGRGRVGAQRHGGGLLHGLDASQRLHLHGAQVPDVASCRRDTDTRGYTRVTAGKMQRVTQSEVCNNSTVVSTVCTHRFVRRVYLKNVTAVRRITCPLFEQLGGGVGDRL